MLQMLEDLDSLDLLVLEATGEASNGIDMYRRVGILTLQYAHERNMASPNLTAALRRAETSLAARLGPQNKGPRGYKTHNKVFVELLREPWGLGSVTIV